MEGEWKVLGFLENAQGMVGIRDVQCFTALSKQKILRKIKSGV